MVEQYRIHLNGASSTSTTTPNQSSPYLNRSIYYIILFFLSIPMVTAYALLFSLFIVGFALIVVAFALLLGFSAFNLLPIVSLASQPQMILSSLGFALLGIGFIYLSLLLFKSSKKLIAWITHSIKGVLYA